MASLDGSHALGLFLSGNQASWPELNISAAELIAICDAEELSPLLYERLARSPGAEGWPPEVREHLAVTSRRLATEEALRGAETRTVVSALSEAGVRPILIKGTALAYGWYDTPVSRPRNDTDLLIASGQVDTARRVLSSLGYTPTPQCQDLFSQFEVQKADEFGVLHAFDVHWKISTQPVFADVLTYEELLPRTIPVPALCGAAFAPGAVDALLLACVHPVMHHRNIERALWTYDIHLLATNLGSAEFDELVRLARLRKVAAICAHGLRQARETFGTVIPDGVNERLSGDGPVESSAEYLASQRRWHHELASSLRGTPSLGGRAGLLRQVLFPSPHYLLGAYGLGGKPLAFLLLPVLYLHRNLRGLWKIVTGKK